jgi:hypothetical protein
MSSRAALRVPSEIRYTLGKCKNIWETSCDPGDDPFGNLFTLIPKGNRPIHLHDPEESLSTGEGSG